MLDYYLEPNTLNGAAPDTYRVVVTQKEGADGEAFIKMAAKTLNISEGEALGTLNGIAQTAQAFIEQGWGFTLPGFGTVGYTVRGIVADPDAPLEGDACKVSLRFRFERALTAAAQKAPRKRLHGIVHGPVIDAVVDLATGAPNSTLTPGGNAKITGKNLKLAGDAAGVSLIAGDGDGTSVPMTAVSRNSPTALVFICPALSAGTYQVQVTTQYTSTPEYTVATPRTFRFETALTVA
jgi:hypothetical protein